ncbi:MAG: hypothetical protein ABI432_00370 [Flavobacteriales bacterium]
MNDKRLRAFWADRSKLIAPLALLLLAGSIGMQVYSGHERTELQVALDGQLSAVEKLRTEQRSSIDRAERMAQQLSASKAATAEQEDQRVLAEQKVYALQLRMEQESNAQANAAQWRKENETLKTERSGLQQQLAEVQAALTLSKADKLSMEQETASLRAEMERLAADRAAVDQSLTQAFRGKHEKLTVLARKTRKLQVSMVLPPSMAKQASYTITDPDGQIIRGDDSLVNVFVDSRPGAMLASGAKGATLGEDQVRLAYIPKKRLKEGRYKIEVKAGERALGSTFIVLR